MNGTRRDFAKATLAGLSRVARMAGVAGSAVSAQAQNTPKPNRSFINGVQFGLQPFCYHDLPMTIENRPELVRRLVQNEMGMVELHATWCEPRFNTPGMSPQEARQKLREWRVNVPADHYRKIKREFDNAGITIFTYYVNVGDRSSGASSPTPKLTRPTQPRNCWTPKARLAHMASRWRADWLHSRPDMGSSQVCITTIIFRIRTPSIRKRVLRKACRTRRISRRRWTCATSPPLTAIASASSSGITNVYRAFTWAIGAEIMGGAHRSAKATRPSSRFCG